MSQRTDRYGPNSDRLRQKPLLAEEVGTGGEMKSNTARVGVESQALEPPGSGHHEELRRQRALYLDLLEYTP